MILTPGARIVVTQPTIPRFVVEQPTTPRTVVVPARGPAGPAGDSDLTAHIADETPHPPYDDAPSLVLLFENGLI